MIQKLLTHIAVLVVLIAFPLTTRAESCSFSVTSYNVSAEEEFSVVVTAQDLVDAGAIDFTLEYDPNLVTYMGTVGGVFMEPIMDVSSFTSPTAGGEEVLVTVLSEGTIVGDGDVATVTFRSGTTGGTTNITLTSMNITTTGFDLVPATVSGVPATVTITVPDGTAPTITAFVIPATASSLTVPITTLTATDNVAVTQYCLMETNSSVGCVWGAKPVNYTFATAGSKTLYAFARDAAGNISVSANDAVTITLPPADTTPPVITVVSPSGALTANTTATTFSVTTDENATCRYGTVAGTLYDAMTTFDSTGTTAHTTTVSGLQNGTSYSYYVRCADTVPNKNSNDTVISFSVANPASTGGSSSGGGGGGSSSKKDTTPPTKTSVAINRGKDTSTSNTVTLSLTAQDSSRPIMMQISESSSFSGASWVSFKESYSWTYTEGNGTRKIYARFKDGKGNTSTAVSDTITLNVTGAHLAVVTPETTPTAPVKSVSSSAYTFTRNLGLGAQGADVIELQKRLRSEGLFTHPTNTGYFGPATADAVKKFQQKYGIDSTGFVGPLTLKRLNSVSGGSTVKGSDDISLADFVRLLIALNIIPKDKADLALSTISSM